MDYPRHMDTIENILGSPDASDWLKQALRTAMQRGPVAAAVDAELLGELLDQRAQAAMPPLTPKWDLLDPA